MEHDISELIEGNREWVAEVRKTNPGFFDNLAKGQKPTYLWIGCSDSRVPATEITKMQPGSIFVQRNIANMVVHTDVNLLSVVYYAVKVLRVKHIIVCGHYGCGGVLAAMGNQSFGFLDNWLMNIKDVYRFHEKELEAIKDEKERGDRLVEINIQEQVNNLSKISFIQEEWEQGQFPYVHGWVYNLEDGLLRDLKVSANSTIDLEKIFHFDGEKIGG